MSKLAIEHQGFLRFIKRAHKELSSWFGRHCNHDSNKITFMAAREWSVMAEEERRYFIRAETMANQKAQFGYTNGSNAYLCYLLHKQHLSLADILKKNSIDEILSKTSKPSLFNPNLSKSLGKEWKNLPQEERNKYQGIKMSELSMDFVIEKRDKLHQFYDPKELAILEFIIKTKPKKPLEARGWFLSLDNYSINSELVAKKWINLSQEDRRFYDVCERLDRQRFVYERNIWLTKLLTLDTSEVDFKLPKFESNRAKSDVETFSSIIGQNRNLIPMPAVKKPPGAFSYFLKDYREQTRSTTKQFVFGKHLKDAAAAWFKLSEKEKTCYRKASEKARENYMKNKLTVEEEKLSSNQKIPLDLTNVLYKKTTSNNELYKPSQLINQKKPNVIDIYGAANNIAKHLRKESWNSLCPADKEPYIIKYETLKTVRQKEKADLKERLSHIRKLIKQAKELKRLKRKLFLIQT